VTLVYNQWTQFADWPTLMKKVEKVVQEEDQKLTFQAKIFWSRRTWQSTIQEQVPDEKIIWTSQGAKGSVDGTVTFHEITPDLTRVLVSLVYHRKGLMELVGGLWRAQGRRVRLEFKHFRRHLMTDALRHPDDIEGWRGTIHEGEVVKDHETALREEREAEERDEREEAGEAEGAEYDDEPGGRGDGRKTRGERGRGEGEDRENGREKRKTRRGEREDRENGREERAARRGEREDRENGREGRRGGRRSVPEEEASEAGLAERAGPRRAAGDAGGAGESEEYDEAEEAEDHEEPRPRRTAQRERPPAGRGSRRPRDG
jgi:hypothetical protein